MRRGILMLMALLAVVSCSTVDQTAGSDYSSLYGAARSRYESRQFGACDSLLTELSHRRLKFLQRRKVCQLMLDNAYHSDGRDLFLQVLDSRYVKRNLDRSDYKYWRTLSLIPATEAVWPADAVSLPLLSIGPEGHDQFGIEVLGNGLSLVGMLDNCCADYCSISTALAERLGVRPIGKTVHANGNRQATSFVGVLDSLSIGGLLVRNVLVDVSDHLEAIKETHPFDIVIGENVLTRTGEMTIDNEAGAVVFSPEAQDLPQNVRWRYPAHDFSVEASLNDHEIAMLLDFGNTNTRLSDVYYSRFPADESYVEGTVTTSMTDRTWTSKVYVIPEARLAFCGAACVLSNVAIQMEEHASGGLDGNLGVDALRRFRRIVFNPDKLYLQLIPVEPK